MRRVLVLLLLSSAGCSGSLRPSVPDGGPPLSPRAVREVGALPSDATQLGELHAGCQGQERPRHASQERLSDLDCSSERMRASLRSAAAAGGADLLTDVRCEASGGEYRTIMCHALAARSAQPTSAARLAIAPDAASVELLDEPRPLAAFDIRVSFAPAPGVTASEPRRYDRVAELPELPVQRRAAGELDARCNDSKPCTEAELRHALRVSAGRVGATEVVAVRCFREAEASRCVATAAAPRDGDAAL